MTRAAIVEAALLAASRDGLEGLTIGTLADSMQMSKSGVFAHFGSREELQLAVLKAYVQRFVDGCCGMCGEAARMPRLRRFWSAGCILAGDDTRCIIALARRIDDVPAPTDEMSAIRRMEARNVKRSGRQGPKVI